MQIKILVKLDEPEELPEGVEPSSAEINRLKDRFPSLNSVEFSIQRYKVNPEDDFYKVKRRRKCRT